MKNINFLIAAFCLMIFVAAGTASALTCTKFVAKTGNDANPGTETQPWLTIQNAANTVVAGDTVCVKAGTYNEIIIPQNSGTSGNWITYSAYPGDERNVIIDGTGLITPTKDTWNSGTIHINFKSYIRVAGFKVINTGGSGIYVGGGNNITIDGNRVEHTAHAGIQLYGAGAVNNYIVSGNEINKHGYNNSDWEALSIARTNGFEIANNIVYDPDPGILAGARILIDAKDGSKNGIIHHNEVYNSASNSMGIYVDSWKDTTIENITIHSNNVHDIAYEGIALNVEVRGTLQNVNVYNNIINNAGNADYGSGIVISSYAWVDASETGLRIIKNMDIYNNVIYQSGSTILPWTGGGIVVGRQTLRLSLDNVKVRNNIVFNNYEYQIRVNSCTCITNVVVSNNLVYPFRGYANEVNGTSYIASDPQFVNPSAADFHIQSSSPAIDGGYDVGVPYNVDLDGNTRPVGSAYDIGAYEYGDLSDTTPPAQITNLAVTGYAIDSVTLGWTAPGDDGNTGTAAGYDLRYSTSPITSANWALATPVIGMPAPAIAGTSESFTVTGLSAATYYFAIKTSDEVPNWSELSNVPYETIATNLNINSISDIQAYCQYFPNSHTYYCTEKLNWGPSGTAAVQETDGPIAVDYSPATFTEKSSVGTFDGTNPITVNAGGTCAPINANASITGICEGINYKSGDCTKLPEVTATRGYFQKHVISSGGCTYRLCSSAYCTGSASFNTGESCGFSANGAYYWDFICCYVSACYATGGSCSRESYINQENLPANCNWGSQTYYTPCAVDPSISVNGMFFQYSGMVKNTTSVNLPLNNFKTGANTLQMSAQESRKFDYTLKWIEVDSPTPCITSQRTKAYHITSGSVLQSGDWARIINGTFSMRFDPASTDTTISLLSDDINSVGSVRISRYDSTNLKLEVYNATGWTLVANNIQPKKWYAFSITLDESENKIMLKMENVEYGTISRTLNIPVASPAIKWISIASDGAWIDNVNIDKRDIGSNLISAYSDNFESYQDNEIVLYSSQSPFYNLIINNDLTPDLAGSNKKNLVVRVSGKFESKSFNMDGVYPGAAGTLDITAKRSIKIDNIYSNSAYESSNDEHIQACGGGTIILKGNNVSVLSIQALGGWTKSQWSAGCGSWSSASSGCGGGGAVYITANTTNIGIISLYSPNVDMHASGGGVTQIDSEVMQVTKINVNGGCGKSGGNGGRVTLKGGNITIPEISAKGCDASGHAYCVGGQGGSGGPINIVARNYTNVSLVLTNGGSGETPGGGGSVRVSTTNIKSPINISAKGASGGVFIGTSGSGNAYEYATPASAGGTVNIYADHIDSEVNISVTGGNAVGMSYFTGFSTGCELGSAGVGGIAAIFSDNQITGNLNINNKGGSGADYRNMYTYDCQILGGSDGGVILRKRTWGGFIGMNASVLDTNYKSYLIRVKDIWTNRYLKQRINKYSDYYYNETFSDGLDSGIMVKRINDAQIGFPGTAIPYLPAFDMALGKDHQLEITASPCDPFDQALCSHLNDRTYIVPFVEY